MLKIGLLSDTHGYISPRMYDFFGEVDEIWHAGDWGSISLVNELEAFKPIIGVYGNIDDYKTRLHFPKFQYFEREGIPILLTHIGGYPNKYDREALPKIMEYKPKLFVCGHSHILKVIYDKTMDLLHINPGAAGKQGIHQKITFVRFQIDKDNIQNLEIFEAEKSIKA